RIPGPVGESSFTESLGLSADGTTLAVGVPALKTVWIYSRAGAVWRRTAQVRPPARLRDFGEAVALSGDGRTLLTRAVRGTSVSTIWEGVTVYGRTSTGWSLDAVIDAPRRPLGATRFGTTLAASVTGDTAVIGAPDDARWDKDMFTYGAVHVYRRSAGRWQVLDTLRIPDRVAKLGFGDAAAISPDGTTLAVGGPRLYTFRDVLRGRSRGGVPASHRYALTGRFGKFQAPGVDTAFGHSLALSADGRTLVAGDEVRTVHGVVAAGRVHRYVRSDTGWRFGGVLDPAPCALPCDRSRSGTAVAVDAAGRRVLVVERADARPWATGVDVYDRR
ncbi:MAG TPA: hypothetical protein VKP64_04565, partial [Mycobacteriales bacterium]|nr:hypothetical protein [Mycobacteriales bacterium]